MTLNRQDFLLYQGQGMLNFGTKQGLDFLVRSQKILCDGYFKTAHLFLFKSKPSSGRLILGKFLQFGDF